MANAGGDEAPAFVQIGQILCPVTGEIITRYFAPDVDGDKVPSFYWSHFTEQELLGVGGYASVVSCRNNFDGQEYAVKKITIGEEVLSFVSTDGVDSDDEMDLADGFYELSTVFFMGGRDFTQVSSYNSLIREARIWSSMNHDNIVRYFESWTEERLWGLVGNPEGDESDVGNGIDVNKPCLYIQLELCDSTLEAKLRPNNCFHWTTKHESAEIFEAILRGLEHIHGKGIMHGDLTKANILFHHGIVKISDFGLARTVGAQNDEPETACNFRPYRAPERSTEDADTKADIYSAGILLFEMLQPFANNSDRARVLQDLRQKKTFPNKAWYNDPVKKWVLRMIDDTPSKRPSAAYLLQNYGEIKDDILLSDAMI